MTTCDRCGAEVESHKNQPYVTLYNIDKKAFPKSKQPPSQPPTHFVDACVECQKILLAKVNAAIQAWRLSK